MIQEITFSHGKYCRSTRLKNIDQNNYVAPQFDVFKYWLKLTSFSKVCSPRRRAATKFTYVARHVRHTLDPPLVEENTNTSFGKKPILNIICTNVKITNLRKNQKWRIYFDSNLIKESVSSIGSLFF